MLTLKDGDPRWPEIRDYVVDVAGHRLPLTYSPGQSRCGKIRDGVSFAFAGEGCWVISFADLVEMARIATEVRAKREEIKEKSNA